MRSRAPRLTSCRAALIWTVTAAVFLSGTASFARPGGGRGAGGRGGASPGPSPRATPGPSPRATPGPGPAPGRPSTGSVVRPGPAPGPARPESVVPGPAGTAGRVMEQPGPGAARAVTGPNTVENFINAKPAGAAAATRTVDSAAAKTRAQSLQASLAGRTQPFTAAWYAEHPNAWRYTHPYAEWWAVAGVAGLSSWLGYSVASASATTAGTTTAAATTQTVAAETAAAETSAEQAAVAPPADLEWMPLGVFATSPKGASQAHVYQQLAVSKQGELKGNYYDAISNAVQPITGSIDRETRKATWAIGTQGGATFETTLDALVQTPSTVTMKSGSSSQEWELVQMEKPAGDAAKP